MAIPRWHWDEDPAILAAVLSRGGVLAVPTESSYGLAVPPGSRAGVDAIFRIKGRQSGEALPILVADLEQALTLGIAANDPSLTRALSHWPAALTVIVDTTAVLPASAGRSTLAIRIPAHPLLIGLLHAVGPLTATSANTSGEPPILEPDELEILLEGNDALIVDGGSLAGGPPSTLVRWNVARGAFDVLRAGAFPSQALAHP